MTRSSTYINGSALDYLIQLREATDKLVAKIKPEDFPNAAINWGDLGCRSVYIGIDESRTVHHLVIIDEAAPGEQEFCRHVADKLKELGWQDVEVITEW